MLAKYRVIMGIGERLKAAAAKVGGQKKLCELADVKTRTLSDWIAGNTSPNLQALEAIAEASDVDLGWLVTGQGNSEQSQSQMQTAKSEIRLPLYNVQAAAGAGMVALEQEVAGWITVSRDWLSRYMPPGARAGIVEARGDSMEPVIRDGDQLVINFSINNDDLDDGGIFVIAIGDRVMVKRLQPMLDGRLRVSSENPSYEPEYLTREQADAELIVHAKVVLVITPPRPR